ncbi:MAG: hypothetical protein ACFCU1_05950 [Sumerlaeia bacterium]
MLTNSHSQMQTHFAAFLVVLSFSILSVSCTKPAVIVAPLAIPSGEVNTYKVDLFETFCQTSVNYATGLLDPNPPAAESITLLKNYLAQSSAVNPNTLSVREGLHYWVNTRNALAIYQSQLSRGEATTAKSATIPKGLMIGGQVLTLVEIDQYIADYYPEAIAAGLLGNGTTSPLPIKPLSLKTDIDYLKIN